MSAPTEVELYFLKGKVERWIRFGTPDQRAHARPPPAHRDFRAGRHFRLHALGFERLRDAGLPDRYFARLPRRGSLFDVPWVKPGAEILLRSFGWDKVQRVLRAIDAVEALGLPPQEICPDHWRHVHSRLAAGLAPRPYSRERHRAWLLRSKITSP